MPGIEKYSTTASENINANTGINWDEGMAPAAVNNSARQNMADLRAAFDDLIWFQYGSGSKAPAPVYSSGTVFTQASGSDLSAVYHVGRRVKAVGSSTGTIYGSISASTYATSTQTVTVVWDSGSLSNESLTVYLSQIPVTGNPIPAGSAVVSKASGVTCNTGSNTSICNVALTPGTWRVSGLWTAPTGSASGSNWVQAGISTASNAMTGAVLGDSQAYYAYDEQNGAGGGSIPDYIVTVAVNTTLYWTILPHTVANLSVSGRLTAIRLF